MFSQNRSANFIVTFAVFIFIFLLSTFLKSQGILVNSLQHSLNNLFWWKSSLPTLLDSRQPCYCLYIQNIYIYIYNPIHITQYTWTHDLPLNFPPLYQLRHTNSLSWWKQYCKFASFQWTCKVTFWWTNKKFRIEKKVFWSPLQCHQFLPAEFWAWAYVAKYPFLP